MNRRRLRSEIIARSEDLLSAHGLPPLAESHHVLALRVGELVVDVDAVRAGLAGSRTWSGTTEGRERRHALAAEARMIASALWDLELDLLAGSLCDLADDIDAYPEGLFQRLAARLRRVVDVGNARPASERSHLLGPLPVSAIDVESRVDAARTVLDHRRAVGFVRRGPETSFYVRFETSRGHDDVSVAFTFKPEYADFGDGHPTDFFVGGGRGEDTTRWLAQFLAEFSVERTSERSGCVRLVRHRRAGGHADRSRCAVGCRAVSSPRETRHGLARNQYSAVTLALRCLPML